jgi:hypothetical protein
MSLGGLISGVMGGAAKGYGDYAQQRLDVDIKKELLQAQKDKELAIDAIKRERDIADIPRRGEAQTDVDVARTRRIGEAQTDVDVARIPQVGAAQTDVDVDRTARVGKAQTGVDTERAMYVGEMDTMVQARREAALRPQKVRTAAELADAEAAAQRRAQAEYGKDPAAREGARARTADTESSLSRVQAESLQVDLQTKKRLASILEQLEVETDPKKREELEDRFKVLSGGKFASRYQAIKVLDDDGFTERTEILDKQTGFTSPPRRAPAPQGGGANSNRPPLSSFNR